MSKPFHVSEVSRGQAYAMLGGLDGAFGRTEEAPRRAQRALAQGTTVWFVLCALGIGALERWSPLILRYLGLSLLAPASLMYFGWLETGYHSLNLATFPLLARGLREGGWHLEAAGALTGLGAALHGFGLVSLMGAGLTVLAVPLKIRERAGRLLRLAAWGTTFYLGWVAIYLIVLKLPIGVGNTRAMPWRPWFDDQILEGRINAALFSATGARDLLFTAWVVGAFLLLIVVPLWRRYGTEVRMALAYASPSVIFTILIWPTQGLGEGMHLVFARFAAVYALAWVCAHEMRPTRIAAVLLASIAAVAVGLIIFWPQVYKLFGQF